VSQKKKVLIYFYHCGTFGHTRRVFNIAQELASDPLNEVLVISGGEGTPFYKPTMQFELIQIPALVPNVDSFAGYRPKMKSIPIDALLKWRQVLLKECVVNFVPDILILEMFPFDRLGLEKEFTELIHTSRNLNPKVKVISSVRDIPETENTYWKHHQDRTREILDKEIDLVLVHGMKDIFDYSQFFKNELAAKFQYTGYVVAPEFRENCHSYPKRQNALLSAGGGKDAQNMLTFFIKYLESYCHRNISWTVLMGDYFHDQDKTELRLMKYPNVDIQKNVIIEDRLLRNYNIHLCMSGYNTLVENIATGVKSIVCARTTSGEQKIRSTVFNEHHLCKVVSLDSSAEDLDNIINTELNTPYYPKLKFNLDGASTTRDLIASLV